jgi:hypothetical protein
VIDLIAGAIGSLFAASEAPGRSGTKRTAAQELVWTLAIMGFPTLDFLLVLGLGAGVALPLPFALAAATFALAVRARGDGSLVFLASSCCLIFCLGASLFGALMGAGGFFGF